ncbi:twin-arginine translocation signal domain-containing protein, partial [Corallococcus sp. AB038B]|uniref:twin-arginine translocation signal domain-containing protein n=2 Tax=Myxococcaceae TaxID=31 RepID=UPI000ED26CF9
MSRRAFLGGSAAVTALATVDATANPPGHAAPSSSPFELEEATIVDLQAGLREGKYTAHGLTERYLARIAAMDRTGSLPLLSV